MSATPDDPAESTPFQVSVARMLQDLDPSPDREGLRDTPAEGAGPVGLVLMSGAIATLLAQWGLIPRFDLGPRAATLWGIATAALGTVVLSDTVASPWCWDFCAGEQDMYPRQNVQSHFIGGTHGSLSIPDLQLWNYRGDRSWYAELTQEKTFVHHIDPYTLQLQHFKAVIDGVEAPLSSALDGLRTLQATLAVADAATSGLAVNLNTGVTS